MSGNDSSDQPPPSEPDVADGGTVRLVIPIDEDGPTIALRADAEDDLPTARISAVAVAEIEGSDDPLDLPTIKIAAKPVRGAPVLDVEATVELTRDALPDELLQPALPFLPPIVLGAVARPPDCAPPSVAPIPGETAPAAAIAKEPLDLAGVATLSADLAGGLRAAGLSRRGITEASWIAAERTWIAKLAIASERGERTLGRAFDEAYLAARATRRGPFDDGALARLRAEMNVDSDEPIDGETLADVADAVRYRRVRVRR